MNRLASPPLIIGISLALLTLGLLTPSLEAAAESTQPGAQALEIAPPVINLSADPGETVTAEINLRDVSDGQLIVTGEVNDFTAGDENGTPKILLDDDELSPYSMRDWFGPINQLLLEPREIKKLPVQISVPADTAPGGYYAVVRFTGTPPDLDGTGVSLSASLGALIFMQVNGDAEEGLEIEEFTTQASNGAVTSLFQSAPITFVERLKNTGNLHQQPSGQITITDMFGRKVATINVNLPPRNILPDSIRKFEQSLDSSVIGNKILFGLYKAELKVTYGTDQQTVTSSLSFWVIPYMLIAIIVVGLIVAFIGLRFLIRRYNRHIIKKAQRGRR